MIDRPIRMLAVAVLLALAPQVFAQDAEEDVETVPVKPLEEPEEDMIPLLPTVQWTFTGNIQGDALASSDLEVDREKDTELRRARLSALLEWHSWRMKLGVDLAEEAPVGEDVLPLRDLSFEYRGWPVYLEFGQFVEPFGMLQSGSRNAALMERPQPAGLGPGYGIGIAANMRGELWGFSIGAFGPTENDVFFGGREEAALTMRGTFAPLQFEDGLVHFGVAVSQREPVDSLLQFVTIPETVLLLGLNTSSERLITEDYRLYGAEFAAQWGPVVVESEYYNADIGEAIVFDDVFSGEINFISPSYTGYYVEAAWTVTGEQRDYSTRRGTFGGIAPETPLFDGGIGAIEVAARRSHTDLTDERNGGERGAVSSVAVNWYPIEYAKVMLEGLRIVEESAGAGREEVNAVQLRVQLHYSLP